MESRGIILPISKYSKFESEIHQLKVYVRRLEKDRVSAMLTILKEDESRLTKCMDDVETYHRHVFALTSAENKLGDIENKSPMNYCTKKAKLSVPEQDFSMNQLEGSIVEQNSAMSHSECFSIKPDYSVNQSQLSVIEPDYWVNQPQLSAIELDYSVSQPQLSVTEPDYSVSQPQLSVTEPDYSVSQPQLSVIEPDYSLNEPGSSPLLEIPEEVFEAINSPGFSTTAYNSDDSDDESSGVQDKSNAIKVNSTEYQNELVQKVLMDLFADDEREITKLVLHLLSKFSCFQSNLRTVEKYVSRLINSPTESMDKAKSMLNRLKRSILYIDQTISKIYAKYYEMLEKTYEN